jgi:hypothetical protein
MHATTPARELCGGNGLKVINNLPLLQWGREKPFKALKKSRQRGKTRH